MLVFFSSLFSSACSHENGDLYFAQENNLKMELVEKYDSTEGTLELDGYSARLYKFSGKQLSEEFYDVNGGPYFENSGIFERHKFQYKKSCFLKREETETSGSYIISDKNSLFSTIIGFNRVRINAIIYFFKFGGNKDIYISFFFRELKVFKRINYFYLIAIYKTISISSKSVSKYYNFGFFIVDV